MKNYNKKIFLLKIPYENVDFKFISSHYDVHLKGTCIYNNELCEFNNEYPEYDENTDDYKDMFVEIYKLNWISKIKWYWKQWLFEQCVGYHWSYPFRKYGFSFYYRKPKWLYVKLFNWYYKCKKK